MGYAHGLIRYSTQNAIAHRFSPAQLWRRVRRPRVLVYTSILVAIFGATVVMLALRVPLKVDVIRDRGALAREVEGGRIENVYRLQIMNTAERSHRFVISVGGIDSIDIASSREVELSGATMRAVPVRVQLDPGKGRAGPNKIEFLVRALDEPYIQVREQAVFIVPR